ncbi:GspH/FimT family pseudopilin [Cognatiluteimonas weifangensis]|uniref:Type II secretion system protein H n=1 Tax=Cognatiluteimonas weifangensis TaxID=2303539 RepID=A0A372DP29_9GAMM|nr:GspH/FimT family pseudopilin [Luteimonas weifangensis]RFP61289.1 prepilin-type N-terminal cleavage/methylation domain-containing protein [Luteimonas weifangensis]
MRRQGGFTLVELMIAMAVLAIVLTLAVPGFESVVNSNRLTGAANELVNALQTARMEAIRRNRRIVVCLSDAAGAATPACSALAPDGWIGFVDVDRDGSYGAGDTLLLTSTVAAPVRVASSASVAGKIVFRSDGLARDAADTLLDGVIAMCIATRRPASNVRHVGIGSGSRISTTQVDGNGVCRAPADPS